MTDIPIVLCFDRRVLLGAAVTIQSLLDTAHDDTAYEINILNPGFSPRLKSHLASLVENSRHSMRFFEIPASRFDGAPQGGGILRGPIWPGIVYYRLLASEVIVDRDKVIYSDVDVVIKKDMADAYATDLTDSEWAGVAAEQNGPHKVKFVHFAENTNERIVFAGFMVMNLALMRANAVVPRYFETIEKFGSRLHFYDMDVLNIATRRILELPLSYVVLEDLYEAEDVTKSDEYFFLKSVYSDAELEAARDDPHIVHFAGIRGKPWQRQQLPPDYRPIVARIPKALKPFNFRDFQNAWLRPRSYRRHSQRSS